MSINLTSEPSLYTVRNTAQPLHGFDAVDDAAIRLYREQGYIAVEDAFTAAQVDDANAALSDLIAGRVPSFTDIQFEAAVADDLESLTPTQREIAVRKLMAFCDHDVRLAALARDERLLDVLRRLLGDEPVIFQEMALLKPPKGIEKPWHQDHAYFDVDVKDRIVGVWIALDEATLDNGCMHVLSSGHNEGPRLHFKRRDWQICDTDMLGVPCTAVPLKPGGLLLFDSLLPHGTPSNDSTHRRRALQFHYAPPGARSVSIDDRLEVFGSEGKDVEC